MENRVTLIGKPECQLCQSAAQIVQSICNELGVGWSELSILDDPKLADQYFELIPVVLVDGKPHAQWTVDPTRLKKALTIGL